jgi:hypothetical protein
VLFEFGLGEARRVRALCEAYVENGGPGRIDRPGNFWMLVAQLGHIGEDACATWLSPNLSDAERVRQAGRAEEFLDLPLTRDTIDRLLSALQD